MKTSSFTWIDWLLLAAIAVLSVLLLVMVTPPTIEWWRNRPRPGMQVRQQYLAKTGSGENDVAVPINYWFYLPPDYDRNAKWPLVVYLHGAGSRGQDLELVRREWIPAQVAQGRHFPFILVAPQCPENSHWWPELLVGLTEHISKSFSVDPDRVYLTGYSMGGHGTWATAAQDPDRFAAIAPLCGGGDPEKAEKLKNLPIWAFHGDKDDVVPLEVTQSMVEAVKKCGGKVEFTIYPGAGHGIDGMTYQNEKFFEWLLDQRRNQHSK